MAELMLVNPSPRRRRRKTKTRRRRRRNPWYDQSRRHSTAAKKGWRRRRRNPSSRRRRRRNPGRRGGMIGNMIMPAVTAAAGAIGIDAILGFVPLPAAMKSGPMRYVVKGAAAIGIGMLLKNMKLVRPATADMFATGALTVALSDAGKDAIARFMPGFAAKAGFAPSVAGLGFYEDEELLGLGYSGAGYVGVDEDMGSLGYYGDEMEGLGADDIEEFEL